MPPAPQDELPHRPAAGDRWRESWSFDFATADGHLGGWIRYTRLADHAWYEAVLAGAHRQLVAVLDHDVPFRSSAFEVRTTGLWADHTCEVPLDHWTLGLEAFAVGVDDPLELLGRQHGDVVALGFDLEWETDGPALDEPLEPAAEGYGVPCRVHGEVLVGAATVDLDALGHRTHRWGTDDHGGGWTLTGAVEGGERWVVHQADAADVHVVDAHGTHQPAATADLRRDEAGLPASATVRTEAGALGIEVLAVAPLPVPGAAGGAVHARALCRLRAEDGRIGTGWLEDRDRPTPTLTA